MAFEFRGAINLANAFIQQSHDGVSFDAERNELESSFQALNNKFKQLSFSYESVLNDSNMLNESLTEFENVQSTPCETAIKTINERWTSYKGSMNGVIKNCQDFINLAQTYKGFLQPEHEISQL